jgi:phospholipase A1/A2
MFRARLVTILAGFALKASGADLAECVAIESKDERLACYDAAAGRAMPAQGHPQLPASEPSLITRYWGLDSTGSDSYLFWPHQPTYVSPLHYSGRVNDAAFQQSSSGDMPASFHHGEVEFQLSLKFRPLRGRLGQRTELWLAYTQQSHWQLYGNSSPFRETNYEPEAFLTIPIESTREMLGFKWRGVNVGIVHQSNGRGGTLSRSWNRLYAQFGFDRDNFALLVKPWWRIPESEDDNPDISNYVGRAEVIAVYKPDKEGHTLSLVARNNLRASHNRGSVEAQWSFPVVGLRTLRLYTKLFSGYGETLIDYNFRQTTWSLGFLLTDWVEPPRGSADNPTR